MIGGGGGGGKKRTTYHFIMFCLRLMLGLMLPTWFLSMWMSNTATAAMMVPILTAILAQIKTVKQQGEYPS